MYDWNWPQDKIKYQSLIQIDHYPTNLKVSIVFFLSSYIGPGSSGASAEYQGGPI
jgi:hypothetical protein